MSVVVNMSLLLCHYVYRFGLTFSFRYSSVFCNLVSLTLDRFCRRPARRRRDENKCMVEITERRKDLIWETH